MKKNSGIAEIGQIEACKKSAGKIPEGVGRSMTASGGTRKLFFHRTIRILRILYLRTLAVMTSVSSLNL